MNHSTFIEHREGETTHRRRLVDAYESAEETLERLDRGDQRDRRNRTIREAIKHSKTLMSTYAEIIDEVRNVDTEQVIDDLRVTARGIADQRAELDAYVIAHRNASLSLSIAQKELALYDVDSSTDIHDHYDNEVDYLAESLSRPTVRTLLRRYQFIRGNQLALKIEHESTMMNVRNAEHALQHASETLRLGELYGSSRMTWIRDAAQAARNRLEVSRTEDGVASAALDDMTAEAHSLQEAMDDYAENEETGPLFSDLMGEYRNAHNDLIAAHDAVKFSQDELLYSQHRAQQTPALLDTYQDDVEHQEYLIRTSEADLAESTSVYNGKREMLAAISTYAFHVRNAIIGRISIQIVMRVREQRAIRDQVLVPLREREKLFIIECTDVRIRELETEKHRRALWLQLNPAQSD